MIELSMAVRVVLGVIGLGLMVSCLCRARHMSLSSTKPLIRYASAAQFGTGMVLVFCATVKPQWATAALMLAPSAALLAQAASARYWSAGLPAPFRRQEAAELPPGLYRRVAGGASQPERNP